MTSVELNPCIECGSLTKRTRRGTIGKCAPCQKAGWEKFKRSQGLDPDEVRREKYRKTAARIRKVPESKDCSRCGRHKPASEFYRHKISATGLQSHCIECFADADRRSLFNERKNMLWGIPRDQLLSIFRDQGEKCGICGTKDFGTRGPHIDHDHETWEIRGILCASCNQGLGLLGDDEGGLRIALDYVSRKVAGRPTIPHNIRARERSRALRQAKPRKGFDYKRGSQS